MALSAPALATLPGMQESQDTLDRDHTSDVAVATPVESDDQHDLATGEDEETVGSGGNGRFITAIGAVVLLVAMFLTWYEVVRGNGFTVHTTGWQTFTNLRFLLLAGAVACLVSPLPVQTPLIVVGRLVIGVVCSALGVRRLLFPPGPPGPPLPPPPRPYPPLLRARRP